MPTPPLPILNSPIPDAFGRRLTSTEARNLRRLGYTAPRRVSVIRLVQSHEDGSDGRVYHVMPDGSIRLTDIRVTIRPSAPLPR